MSNSLQHHGLQTARHLCPWEFRQEYWSGLPCPPPGDLPDPRIVHRSPTLQKDSLPSETAGKHFQQWLATYHTHVYKSLNISGPVAQLNTLGWVILDQQLSDFSLSQFISTCQMFPPPTHPPFPPSFSETHEKKLEVSDYSSNGLLCITNHPDIFQEVSLHHVGIIIIPIKVMGPPLQSQKDSVMLWHSARDTQGAEPGWEYFLSHQTKTPSVFIHIQVHHQCCGL